MGAPDIDSYLASLAEPQRSTLQAVRGSIRSVLPAAEEAMSYGLPAFKLHGKTVAGFGAFKTHLSYLPHSGSVIPRLNADLTGYTSTKGSLHFPNDQPLPGALVAKLVAARLDELGLS